MHTVTAQAPIVSGDHATVSFATYVWAAALGHCIDFLPIYVARWRYVNFPMAANVHHLRSDPG